MEINRIDIAGDKDELSFRIQLNKQVPEEYGKIEVLKRINLRSGGETWEHVMTKFPSALVIERGRIYRILNGYEGTNSEVSEIESIISKFPWT